MPSISRNRTNKSERTNRRAAKDAIALLREDHKNVKQLLKQLAGTTDRNTRQREQLLAQVENEVKVHTTIEEEIFYPAFREALRSRSDAHLYYEALEEHHVVDMVMPEIRITDSDTDEFSAKAKVLKDLIEHHAEEEEKQMFPKAKKLMSTAELKDLGQQLQERKDELSSETTSGRRRPAA